MTMRRPMLRLIIGPAQEPPSASEHCTICWRRLSQRAVSRQVHRIEHHLAHLSSAFHVSPFDEAVVVSIDGFGDFASAAWGTGSGSEHQHRWPRLFSPFARHLLSGADPVSRLSSLRR